MSRADRMVAEMEKHLPAVKATLAEAKGELVELAKISATAEVDFNESRTNLKRLVVRCDEALDVLMELARDSEHPQVFQVLNQMLRTSADITRLTMEMSQMRKSINDAQRPGGEGSTNNAFFVGTTSDLQDMLKQAKGKTL